MAPDLPTISVRTPREHYDVLLGDIYTWMLGELDARIDAQVEWIRGVAGVAGVAGVEGVEGEKSAIDLGAGSGAEALALARLGYRVVAVDANATLAGEMRARFAEAARAEQIDVAQSDLVDYLETSRERVSLVVCLGDTLTHLDSLVRVQRMFRAARARVVPGGRLVITYRDLSTDLRGLDRFFLVRADASRILTCFVEPMPDRAIIHDLVHVRGERGWEMRKSCYPKLRLPIARVIEWLVDAGFEHVERVPCAGGLVGIIAQ